MNRQEWMPLEEAFDLVRSHCLSDGLTWATLREKLLDPGIPALAIRDNYGDLIPGIIEPEIFHLDRHFWFHAQMRMAETVDGKHRARVYSHPLMHDSRKWPCWGASLIFFLHRATVLALWPAQPMGQDAPTTPPIQIGESKSGRRSYRKQDSVLLDEMDRLWRTGAVGSDTQAAELVVDMATWGGAMRVSRVSRLVKLYKETRRGASYSRKGRRK